MGAIAIEKFRHIVFPSSRGALWFDFGIGAASYQKSTYRLRVALPLLTRAYPPSAPATPDDIALVPGRSIVQATHLARLDFLGATLAGRQMRLALLQDQGDARSLLLGEINFRVPNGYLPVIPFHTSFAGPWDLLAGDGYPYEEQQQEGGIGAGPNLSGSVRRVQHR